MSDAANKAPAIIARQLSKRFGSFVAVDHVDFTITPGEIMGFIGPNGAGKSTIIRMLCGLLRPSGGQISWPELTSYAEPEMARERIGYMSQKFSLYGDLSVRENLQFFGGIYRVPPKKLAERMRYAIDMAGLTGREDDLVSRAGWRLETTSSAGLRYTPQPTDPVFG